MFAVSSFNQDISSWDVSRVQFMPGITMGELLTTLNGRNRAIVIAESLARVIAAIRIASGRWRSYLRIPIRPPTPVSSDFPSDSGGGGK